MATEQRIVAQPKIGAKGGKIGGSVGAESETPAEPPKKSRKKLLIIVLVAVLVLAGAAAAYFLLLAPTSTGTATPKPTATQKAGPVLTVDAISVNLADGHYLRLGLALQLTDKVSAKDEPSTAKALDSAITEFSGRTVAEVQDPATREKLRGELEKTLATKYDEEVMGVYFTNFVTQ